MDWNKIAPRNGFRKEQESEARAITPVRAAEPFLALRGEMDRAFEDVFRRFGIPAASTTLGIARSQAAHLSVACRWRRCASATGWNHSFFFR